MRMSTLHQHWNAFKRHKRGLLSLWCLLCLLMFVLSAKIWCNSSPLLIICDGKIYSPVFFHYTERSFGGEFHLKVNYKSASFKAIIREKGGGILWPLITYDARSVQTTRPAPAPPSQENWLGTDDQGRDVLARLIYGLRTSLTFGFLLTVFSCLFGVFIGGIQGYFGGRIDFWGQRFIEVWSGLPILFLLIILNGIVRPHFWWILAVVLPFSWMNLASLVRAEFLRVRKYDYIRAAQALGVSTSRLIWYHALPNACVATLTSIPFMITHAIVTLASLDFLGFGMPIGSASLGELLQQGKNNLHAPWLGITAFLSISILLVLLAFVGEAVRDTFDPKSR